MTSTKAFVNRDAEPQSGPDMPPDMKVFADGVVRSNSDCPYNTHQNAHDFGHAGRANKAAHFRGALTILTAQWAAIGQYTCPLNPGEVRDPFPYQLRGDRCEGIFSRATSADGMAIIGYSIGQAGIPSGDIVILANWHSPVDVLVRGSGSRKDRNFRMDASVRNASSFQWRGDVRNGAGVRGERLAPVITARWRVGRRLRQVLIPAHTGARFTGGRPFLTIVPEYVVAHVRLQLFGVATSGEEHLISNELVAREANEGEAIRVPLRLVPDIEVYRVLVRRSHGMAVKAGSR
ncbi:MAG TPA: hypothetical protein VES20_18350 [Bryobacteraceae bacterium]|nr:hypothetical protein [Bryobacteraceae bacterium]